MLIRNFTKMLIPAIFCVFMQANAGLNAEQQLALGLFGEKLLNFKKTETNSQVRGFINKLFSFVQNVLFQSMQPLDLMGEVTLGDIIWQYVEILFNQLKLNRECRDYCRNLVIHELSQSLLQQQNYRPEARYTYVYVPYFPGS